MSNLMYNEIPGRPTWQSISIHDDTRIHGFFGDYRFLSNFEPCNLTAGYKSTEAGYMAAKVKAEHRHHFKTMTAAQAKKRWKEFELVDASAAEWDARKESVMYDLLKEKFDAKLNPELHAKLKATGDRELVESNWWSDVVWGVDYKKGGQNLLGKMLMEIRDLISR